MEKTGAWQILEDMLHRAERADELTICSFAMAEGFMRRIIKEKHRIGKITVILDLTVATRKRANMLFIARNVDELYLCNTHAKLILIESEKYTAVCALSANATMNYRYECGILSESGEMITAARQSINNMKNDGQRTDID